MDPTLGTHTDGRPTLRFERHLKHPPELVWQAITEPAQLNAWYPLRALAIDLRIGGRIEFDGMHAVVTQLDPPKVFAFSEHAPPEMPRESDDLVPPTGLLLAARHDGDLAGCGGFRVLSPGVAELSRVFLRPELRGRGGAQALLAALERAALAMGLRTVRLDTRKDLVEARRLYARNGYAEIAAYNDSPYADHWFEKHLA